MTGENTGTELQRAPSHLKDAPKTTSAVTDKDAKVDSPPTQASLQDLAVTKSMKMVLNPDFKGSEFASLEPRLQQLLFEKLRDEIVRLQGVELDYHNFTEDIPQADKFLGTRAGRRRLPLDGDEPDAYLLQDRMRDKWLHESEIPLDDLTSRSVRNDVKLTYTDLVYAKPDGEFTVKPLDARHDSTSGYMYERISSQLLQYRLTVMFGMLPPSDNVDGYKGCWEATFLHHDDGDGISRLTFSEHKGSAMFRFIGSAEASLDAIELIKYLCGNEFPHSYDGIVAGTQA